MEREEYERIALTYMDVVFRAALCAAKSVDDAEDIVQNTYLKLFSKPVRFHDEAHIRRWLIRVAVNESNSLWRSYWRRNVSSAEEETSAEAPMFDSAEYADLYHALQRLPAKLRIVTHLFYYEEYSSKEIAAALNIREPTVRSRLARARKLLKMDLEGEED